MDANLIEKRKQNLDSFVNQGYDIIVDFAGMLQLEKPFEVLKDPAAIERMINVIHDLIKDELIEDEDRIWLMTGVGYTMGESLIQRYQGYWNVNENESSDQYGRFVVFATAPAGDKHYPIDILEAAKELIDTPAPRDLKKLLTEIEAVLV